MAAFALDLISTDRLIWRIKFWVFGKYLAYNCLIWFLPLIQPANISDSYLYGNLVKF